MAGAGRAVTLRLEPYGCGRVSNGARDVTAAAGKDLLRRLGDRARASDDTRRVVAELNASPPLQLPHRGCIPYGSPDRGARLLLFAVAPDEVVPAWADAAGYVDNGVRRVLNKALVQELVGLT